MTDFPDEMFRSMVEATTDFVGTVDRHGGLLYLNPAGRAMLEIPLDEDITGQSVLPYNEGPPEEVIAAAREALDTGATTAISVFVSRSGKRIVVTQTFIVHETSMGTRYSTIARDISDRIAVEESLRHRADHDTLTGLLNRSAFARIADLRDRTPCTRLSMLDLDRFKAVNDSRGHLAGDALLIEVGAALTKSLPGNALVARLGGDEFVVVTEGDPTSVIRGALDLLLDSHGAGVSIGVAGFDATTAIESAMRQADQALYVNKRLRSLAEKSTSNVMSA